MHYCTEKSIIAPKIFFFDFSDLKGKNIISDALLHRKKHYCTKNVFFRFFGLLPYIYHIYYKIFVKSIIASKKALLHQKFFYLIFWFITIYGLYI